MTLSIIMPMLNEANGIEEALATLAPLRARDAELIVVDGGSNDGTIARAAPLADQVLTAPRGRALQMNAGAAAARGDVLLFLHADTRLPENADAFISKGLAHNTHAWGRFDVRFAEGTAMRVIGAMINLRSRLTGIATGDQAMFVTRAAFDQVGGFPPIALMEDVRLSKRLKLVSHPLCIPTPVLPSARRWRDNGLLRTVLLMWWLRLAHFLGRDPARLARTYGYTGPESPGAGAHHHSSTT